MAQLRNRGKVLASTAGSDADGGKNQPANTIPSIVRPNIKKVERDTHPFFHGSSEE